MSEIVSNHHQQVNEARKLEINSWNIHLTTTYYYFPLLPLFQYFAWFHISSSNIFIGAALSLCFLPSLGRMSCPDTDCGRQRQREFSLWFVVIWSLILTDPYQSPVHCFLFTPLRYQTKWPAGWIQDAEALSLLTTEKQPIHGQAGLTSPSIISNDRMDLITESEHPTTSLYSRWMLHTLHKEKKSSKQAILKN